MVPLVLGIERTLETSWPVTSTLSHRPVGGPRSFSGPAGEAWTAGLAYPLLFLLEKDSPLKHVENASSNSDS